MRCDRSRRELIPGYHAVRETLLRGFPAAEALWIVHGRRSVRLESLCVLAAERGIPVIEVDASELESGAPGIAHQGVALLSAPFSYTPLDDAVGAVERSESGLVLVLDHITDEGNFGAILRTAAFFGVHCVVIPKDRSAQVTPSVVKRASGAHAFTCVSRVVNLGRAIEQLKEAGYWVVGAAGEAPAPFDEFDWRVPVALVMGNERKGLGTAVRKSCDHLVSIPSVGPVESLNVSVAAGVLLGEASRQRRGMWERTAAG